MDWNLIFKISIFLSYIIIGILIFGSRNFIKTYFDEKAKHLATKENFNKLLEQLKIQTQETKKIEEEIKELYGYKAIKRQKLEQLFKSTNLYLQELNNILGIQYNKYQKEKIKYDNKKITSAEFKPNLEEFKKDLELLFIGNEILNIELIINLYFIELKDNLQKILVLSREINNQSNNFLVLNTNDANNFWSSLQDEIIILKEQLQKIMQELINNPQS